MHPWFLLVVAAVGGVARATVSHCWEHPICQEITSERSVMLKLCYSIGYFRWGKPDEGEQCSVKCNTSESEEEESSAELFSREMRGRELPREMTGAEDKEKVGQEELDQHPGEDQKKSESTYKMKHFRWGGARSKRYGGFMKSWDERNKTSLLTLLRNIIYKGARDYKKE